MADEKVFMTESLEKHKPSRKDRVRNICKRFWWLFLLVAAIIVLIIVLPIVYVAYPKAARRAVRGSELDVTSMSILNPTPGSVELSVVENLSTHSSYHPTLYPFNASLYLLDDPNVPFLSLETTEAKAHNNATVNVGPQRVNITHLDQFTNFVLMVAASEEFTYALRGHGNLKEGGLPKVDVGYDKNITMKGLNGLAGFTLNSFDLLNATQIDGTNAIAGVTIPNPSVMAFALGNVTLSLSVNGTAIGTATLPDLVLEPGNNTLTMYAEVYELVAGSIALQMKTAILPVDIQGNISTFNGQQLPYYNTMLKNTILRTSIDISKAMRGGP